MDNSFKTQNVTQDLELGGKKYSERCIKLVDDFKNDGTNQNHVSLASLFVTN